MFHSKSLMRNLIRKRTLIFLFLLAASCVPKKQGGNSSPQKRLTDYISKSFSVNRIKDREILVEYLTGNAKQRLTAWSDEQFRQAFIESKREFIKLAFREVKNISPVSVQITYELSYRDQLKRSGAKITNKKLCHLVLERGQWFITEVQNIKELVEYSNELALP